MILPDVNRAEAAAKLKLLRKAAREGFDALDRGAFKEFGSADELRSHLNAISDRIIPGAGE
jgi:antitoxin ParD1/3/4